MKPEVILLDCGGTLAWPPFRVFSAILEDLKGVTVDLEASYRAYYRANHALDDYLRIHRDYPAGDSLSLNHWVFAKGLELEGFPQWDMRCTRELLRREGCLGHWSQTYPWVGDALKRLQAAGYRLAVVSNSDGHVAELLAELGYAQYMETIVDSCIEGISKPDPRLFYIALKRMGLEALVEQARAALAEKAERPPVLYVGDTFRADYAGPRRAGLDGLLVDPLGLYEGWGAPTVRDMSTFADELCGA